MGPPVASRRISRHTSNRITRIHKIQKKLSGAGLGSSRSFFQQMPLIVAAPQAPFAVTIALIMNGHTLKDIYNYCLPREPIVNSLISEETRRANAITIRERVYWMNMEQKCRHLFRRLAQAWLEKKYRGNLLNTEDPATMCVPKNPVYLYRPALRGTWVFEANSLFKCIKKDLGFAEWLFPYPKHPKNPFTNAQFTELECEYLFQKLHEKHYTHWKIEAYRQCCMSIKVFRDAFITPLKLSALSEFSENPDSDDCVELVTDFVEDQIFTQNHTAPNTFSILRWAIRNRPRHPYVELWREIFCKYTRFQFLYGDEFVLITPHVRESMYREIVELFNDTDSIAELSLAKIDQAIERERILQQNTFRELIRALNMPPQTLPSIPNIIVIELPFQQNNNADIDGPDSL
jgi:hypothetical protein